MRITSKGQVTIPKDIREKLGVGPGGEVRFVQADGKIIVEATREDGARAAAEHMLQHLRELGRMARRTPMSDKQLMEMTRGPFNDLDAD